MPPVRCSRTKTRVRSMPSLPAIPKPSPSTSTCRSGGEAAPAGRSCLAKVRWTGSSMPFWRAASLLAIPALLAGCALGETPERAEILAVRGVATRTLEVTQQLRFSDHMRQALDNGIPLRLAYRIDWCDGRRGEGQVIELRYSPLGRDYRMRRLVDGEDRRFSRPSPLFAAL